MTFIIGWGVWGGGRMVHHVRGACWKAIAGSSLASTRYPLQGVYRKMFWSGGEGKLHSHKGPHPVLKLYFFKQKWVTAPQNATQPALLLPTLLLYSSVSFACITLSKSGRNSLQIWENLLGGEQCPHGPPCFSAPINYVSEVFAFLFF